MDKSNIQIPNISRYELDRFVLNELDKEELERIQIIVNQDPELKKRVENIRAQVESFENQFPTFRAIQNNQRKEHLISIWKRICQDFIFQPRIRLAFGTALVLVILSVTIPFLQFQPKQSQKEYRSKGNTAISLYIKRNDELKKTFSNKSNCLPGDTLQFFVVSPNPVFYAVLSRINDSTGLKKYLPLKRFPSRAGNNKGESVEKSIILEENWEGETIFFLFSPRSFQIPGTVEQILTQTMKKDSDLTLEKFELVNPN